MGASRGVDRGIVGTMSSSTNSTVVVPAELRTMAARPTVRTLMSIR